MSWEYAEVLVTYLLTGLSGSQILFHRPRIASFNSEGEARNVLVTLWREVEMLESPAEVERAAARWLERRRGERTVV